MAQFNGYLLKAVSTGKIFPHQYIALESYASEPNHREEIKAYRDDNTRNLTRITAQGTKTSISFTTRPNLHLSEKEEIQKFFTDAESVALERKIQLEYWNDESNMYKTGYFYRTDINFPIKQIMDNDIIYKDITIKLVEY